MYLQHTHHLYPGKGGGVMTAILAGGSDIITSDQKDEIRPNNTDGPASLFGTIQPS